MYTHENKPHQQQRIDERKEKESYLPLPRLPCPLHTRGVSVCGLHQSSPSSLSRILYSVNRDQTIAIETVCTSLVLPQTNPERSVAFFKQSRPIDREERDMGGSVPKALAR